MAIKRTAKSKPAKRFTVQYRYCGGWASGNAYDTRAEAEQAAKRSGRDYQIV